MLMFCLRSLWGEYGWRFFLRIAAPHPVKTVKAFFQAGRLDYSGDQVFTSHEEISHQGLGGRRPLVGVGFCLKPLDTPCLSGHSNHNCHYLEHLLSANTPIIPECCRRCVIRELGLLALTNDSPFYIMTSAKDILQDVYVPALKDRQFSSGLFTLCRYSFKPFALGLLVSGINGAMFPFEKGDCQDYRTWLLADRGIKKEQTLLNERTRQKIERLLGSESQQQIGERRFVKRGNVLYPITPTAESKLQ